MGRVNFDFWTTRSSVEVVGFSYGAIKALEYTLVKMSE